MLENNIDEHAEQPVWKTGFLRLVPPCAREQCRAPIPRHPWMQHSTTGASGVVYKSLTKDQPNCCWRSAADVYLDKIENSINMIKSYYSQPTAHSCYEKIININTSMNKCLVCYNPCLRRCYWQAVWFHTRSEEKNSFKNLNYLKLAFEFHRCCFV